MISLMIYPAEEMKHSEKKARIVVKKSDSLRIFPEKKMARNTTRFLYHCGTRSSCTYALRAILRSKHLKSTGLFFKYILFLKDFFIFFPHQHKKLLFLFLTEGISQSAGKVTVIDEEKLILLFILLIDRESVIQPVKSFCFLIKERNVFWIRSKNKGSAGGSENSIFYLVGELWRAFQMQLRGHGEDEKKQAQDDKEARSDKRFFTLHQLMIQRDKSISHAHGKERQCRCQITYFFSGNGEKIDERESND